MREAMGVVTSERHGVFSSNQCAMIRKAIHPQDGEPVVVNVTHNDPIFITVDPTGGGGECVYPAIFFSQLYG